MASDPCPYTGCTGLDLAILTPSRRKDHLEVHKSYERRLKSASPNPPELTAHAILSGQTRGYPPAQKPATLSKLERYYRIIGFPKLQKPLPDNFKDICCGDAALKDTATPAKTEETWVDGFKLPSLEELGVQRGPYQRFCDKPGCNMIEITQFSQKKLEGHNWIHTTGDSYYDDNPKYQWIYDLEAGYFFDGVKAVWHHVNNDDEHKDKTAEEKKREVIEWLWKFGWEAAPDYRALEPSSRASEFLYGRCWAHKEDQKIFCRVNKCGVSGKVWKIIESLIGRIEVPELGRVTSLTPEPARRIGEVRLASSNRIGAVEALLRFEELEGGQKWMTAPVSMAEGMIEKGDIPEEVGKKKGDKIGGKKDGGKKDGEKKDGKKKDGEEGRIRGTYRKPRK